MPRSRDGPAPQKTTPGQGIDERALALSPPNFLRKSARTATPHLHHRVRRRRQDPAWRGWTIRVYAPPTTDGAHALYTFLKLAAQRYGLAVGDVREIPDPDPVHALNSDSNEK
jgi:hypothetical protein